MDTHRVPDTSSYTELPGQDDGVWKETTFALSTLFLESACVDTDTTTLR